MTDEEIMKALECCNQEDACPNCPYNYACYDDKYKSILSKDALDLINRQIEELDGKDVEIMNLKHEIERLNVELVGMRGACESYKMHYDNAQAEIKRLHKVQTAKAETIKEFEKLVTRRLNCNTPRGAYLLNIMNEVKKEMMESQ